MSNIFQVYYLNNNIKSDSINKLSLKDEKYSDNFIFKYQNKTYQINGMEFIKVPFSPYFINTSHSFLGLQISSKDVEKMKVYYKNVNNQNITNFVDSIENAQSNNLNISNHYWTIKYFDTSTNNIDGIFSFGEPPHIYDPSNYKSENFKEINTEAGYDNLYWGLKFNNIDFINRTNNKIIYSGKYFKVEYCLIYPEIKFFLTTEIFFSRIKQFFFNKFVVKKKKDKNYNNSICYEKFASIVDNSKLYSIKNYHNEFNGIYDIFYCDKTKIIEYGEERFYNEFPTIKFDHLLLGYNFEFDAKDLFDEIDGNVYFLMALKIDRGDKWVLGKTFMKKYQIVFNNDMKTIGFYLNNNKIKKDISPDEIIISEDNNKYKYYCLIIVFIIFIFIILYCLRSYCVKIKYGYLKIKKQQKSWN